MAEPAGERLAGLLLPALGHEQEGRRARPAVQIFVAAADREIGPGGVQLDRERAGAVRQIPERQRAGVMRRPREVPHVVHAPAAVVDVGQHQQRGLRVERRFAARPAPTARSSIRSPSRSRRTLRDVEVGREVAPLRDDHPPARPQVQGGRDQLEQIDRDRIGDDHLMGFGADQAGDLGPDPLREIDPAVAGPAGDQILAPLAPRHLVEDRRGGLGQGAERVAVQIDDAVGQQRTAHAKPPADRRHPAARTRHASKPGSPPSRTLPIPAPGHQPEGLIAISARRKAVTISSEAGLAGVRRTRPPPD